MKAAIEWNGKVHEFDTEQRVLILESGEEKLAMMYMPGVPIHVVINVSGPHPVWSWNGALYKPTFSPSILTQLPWGDDRKEIRNHVFVRNGMIQYLGDCSHEYAGKTMELPRLCDWPEDLKLWSAEVNADDRD